MMIICSANAKMLFLPHTPLNQASRRPPGEVLGTNAKTAITATTVRRTASRNGSGMSRSTYRTHAFVKRFIGSPGRQGWSVTARDAAGAYYPARVAPTHRIHRAAPVRPAGGPAGVTPGGRARAA